MPQEFWLVAIAIGLISLAAGFIHSAIGFGFGIVAISLLPFVVDAKAAHIVVSVASVPMLMMAAWTYREGVEKRSLLVALIGAAIFLPLGLILFERVSLDLLVRGTGLGILAMVAISLRPHQIARDQKASGLSCFVAGATSGFLAGAVSIAGPPVAAFALKQDWSQERYKAFVTQCLLLMAIYKAVLLVARSHFDGPVVEQTAITAVLSIVGVQLGAMASRKIPAMRFKRLVAGALIAVAVVMLVRGQPPKNDVEPAAARMKADIGVNSR